ncbi:MAG: hypothetical protein IAX22_07545 [Candidatus Bathyarchaeota archaeon]|nr:hypothetical protein [Candidatus Bathyarchaeota archaeon]
MTEIKNNKKIFMILFVVIATLLIMGLFSTMTTSSKPNIETAGPESQFDVDIAYAYAGPFPPNETSYFNQRLNVTMFQATKYPSAVILDFTGIYSPKMNSYDAFIEVYGVKIIADTGPTEYFVWSAGTNNTSIAIEDLNTLIRYKDNIVDLNLYRSLGGTFCYYWETGRSVLSETIGSVGIYTSSVKNEATNIFDLSSAGTPNKISIEVCRIGYVTMTNSSVTTYTDNLNSDKPIATVELCKYGDGFIYNTLVPTEQLPESDLFNPKK